MAIDSLRNESLVMKLFSPDILNYPTCGEFYRAESTPRCSRNPLNPRVLSKSQLSLAVPVRQHGSLLDGAELNYVLPRVILQTSSSRQILSLFSDPRAQSYLTTNCPSESTTESSEKKERKEFTDHDGANPLLVTRMLA